jgi:fructose 1,6-bisphosphatase
VRCSNLDSFVYRIVVFKGQVFGMHSISELFIVHLVPRIRLQEIAVDLEKRLGGLEDAQMWLVECGDMLLMVRSPSSFPSIGNTCEAFALTYRYNLQSGWRLRS